MIAADTNVLARVILKDDPSQYEAALGTLQRDEVLITATVLLELLWVLRSLADLTDRELRDVVRTLAAWPTVTIVTPSACEEFLRLWEGGLDLEDAAHLAFVGDVDTFVTFDRALVKRAKKLGSVVVAEAPRSRR
jgi:predicted nucleic acid-binding protein